MPLKIISVARSTALENVTRQLVKCTRETENRPEFGKINCAEQCIREVYNLILKLI